jgi:PAS domain S-box-containing protein
MTNAKSKPLKLLIIEDSKDDCALLLRELQRNGYDVKHALVETAEGMQEALAIAEWDVIICDYSMPRFNAIEALSILKQSGRDIPFIIVSGAIGEETAVEAMKAGAHDYLMKNNLLRLSPAIERERADARVRQERVLGERALHESELKFRLLFNNNPIPMWLIDYASLAVREANDAATRCYGYSPQQFLAHKFTTLFAIPSDENPGETVEQRFRRSLAEHRALDWTHTLQNGRSLEVEIQGDVLSIGDSRSILVTAQDITQRKQTERNLIVARELALQTSQYKSEFLANVSHEIRTPLNGIIGMVDVLGHTPLSDKQKEYVDIIRISADSQLDVVGKVLDFSKIEIGKMVISTNVIDTNNLLKEMTTLIAPRAAIRKLTFKSELAPSVPPKIIADEVRLKQIIKNLLENAIKFTQAGGISLRFSMAEGASTPSLRVEVEDTGIGVPEALRTHLFTPFYQVDSSLTRKYGGTGLGLAICKQLAVLMGGEIGFNSTEGSGSTFWFLVPIERPPLKNGAASEA